MGPIHEIDRARYVNWYKHKVQPLRRSYSVEAESDRTAGGSGSSDIHQQRNPAGHLFTEELAHAPLGAYVSRALDPLRRPRFFHDKNAVLASLVLPTSYNDARTVWVLGFRCTR